MNIAVVESLDSRLLFASVALYFDPAYVSTTGTQSGVCVKAALEGAGHTVKTFTGTSQSAWTAGLSGVETLVIPALSRDLPPALTLTTRQMIASSFRSGLGIVNIGASNGRNFDLWNAVLGYGLKYGTDNFWTNPVKQTAATGTNFESGPASLLRYPNDIDTVAGLPTGAKSMYAQNTTPKSDAFVATWDDSQGTFAALAFSYKDAGPLGTLDGGWLQVLDAAVKETVRVPNVPSNLVATVQSSSSIKLAWTDTASTETGFRIERATSATGPFAFLATVGKNVTTFTNTGLPANTQYYYRVKAYNTGGSSSPSNTAGAKTSGTSAFATLASGTLKVTGTSGNDVIYLGVSGSNVFARLASNVLYFSNTSVTSIKVYAGSGNDRVTAGTGVRGTVLYGEDGNDTICGGQKDDALFGGNGNDLLIGNAGVDYFDGGAGDDWLFSQDGIKESLNGGSGIDFAQVDAADVRSLLEDVLA